MSAKIHYTSIFEWHWAARLKDVINQEMAENYGHYYYKANFINPCAANGGFCLDMDNAANTQTTLSKPVGMIWTQDDPYIPAAPMICSIGGDSTGDFRYIIRKGYRHNFRDFCNLKLINDHFIKCFAFELIMILVCIKEIEKSPLVCLI